MTSILSIVALQILVSVFLILWTRASVRRFLGSDEEISRVRREIGALIIELDSSADRNVTVLEDRLSALKDLLAEADKRIAVLGQERTRRLPDDTVYDRLGRATEPKQIPVVEPLVPFIRFSEKPLPIEEPFADKVVSLSRRGFSSDIIAARLGVTMTEVDLVLSMERERDARSKE
ncbi:MAG: hypothetical protein A2Z96_01190 [Spirochaetes bacterium GWB1_48_6]|nr:MAG: hypothetical protein A2Z96_01190 [Spirochaetes bacterium GWB1_48_6]